MHLILGLLLQNEKTQRTSRSSASPKRLSLSPQSSYGVVQPSARPSSPPHYSSSPVIRQTTPSQRSSTPTKPSTPTHRSSTPTPQRMSSGLSGQTSTSGRRGTSPVNMNRGHSASPKLRGWQSNSFPIIDAPPNYRTSLPDRLSSRVWGSSPASENSMVSSSKVGRRSMSPSASRKARSSHNHESHQFTSCNKASLASSGDDGVGSLLSVGLSGNAAIRKYGSSANSKAITSYRKPSSFPSSGSGPRRSLDSAVRQIVSFFWNISTIFSQRYMYFILHVNRLAYCINYKCNFSILFFSIWRLILGAHNAFSFLN